MRDLEQQKDDLEKQESLENTKRSLLNFWTDPKKDKEFMENPNSWNIAVSAIKDDIKEKSKSIKSDETKRLIDEKLASIEKIGNIGKLDLIQAQFFSLLYQEISSLQWTEIKENYIQSEEYRKEKEKLDDEKLKILIEALEKFLKTYEDEEIKKREDNNFKTKTIMVQNNKETEKQVASAEWIIKWFPLSSQKESPSSQA